MTCQQILQSCNYIKWIVSPLFQTNNLISSEDDAAMALQVSKALTSALLKYRLKSVPSDKVSCFLMPVSAWPWLSQLFECLGCVTFTVQRSPSRYDLIQWFSTLLHGVMASGWFHHSVLLICIFCREVTVHGRRDVQIQELSPSVCLVGGLDKCRLQNWLEWCGTSLRWAVGFKLQAGTIIMRT